jgi:hypothetical protein
LCFIGDGGGSVLRSDNVLGGVWELAASDPGRWVAAIACAGTERCVAVDNDGATLTDDAPEVAASEWQLAEIDGSAVIWDLSCPTPALCVAGDINGSTLVGVAAA